MKDRWSLFQGNVGNTQGSRMGYGSAVNCERKHSQEKKRTMTTGAFCRKNTLKDKSSNGQRDYSAVLQAG